MVNHKLRQKMRKRPPVGAVLERDKNRPYVMATHAAGRVYALHRTKGWRSWRA